MGANCCKPEPDEPEQLGAAVKAWRRPKWKSDEPLTEEQLQRMREEYWDTSPYYGGDRVIWDALHAACDAELSTARIILDSAGVIVAAPDMSVCYDERGRKYELPLYVICAPTNLVRESGKRGSSAQLTASGGGAVELPAVAAGAGSAAGSGGGGSPTPDSHPETAPLNQVAVR